MAEEKMKSWMLKFKKDLSLDEAFEVVYKGILQADKENIDTKYSSYPAGIAYLACLMSEQLGVTQEMIAIVADCSRNSLRKRYKAIRKRNLDYFMSLMK